MPYRYGSYAVYKANKDTQTYQINSYMNLTSQDAAGLWPQFMYESVLKTATGKDNFTF